MVTTGHVGDTAGTTGETSAADGLVELVDRTGRASSIGEIARVGAESVNRTLAAAGVGLLVAGDEDDSVAIGALARPLLSEIATLAGVGELWVADTGADPRFGELARAGIGALGLVPLAIGDRHLGALLALFSSPHAVGHGERALLRAAAGHLAVAIQGRRTERELAAQLEGERRARRFTDEELARRRRLEQHRELLIQAGASLAESLDIDETLLSLSKLVVPHFADWYVVRLVDESGEIVPAQIVHMDPDKVALARDVVERWPTRPDAPTGTALAIRTNQPSLLERIEPKLLADMAQDAEHLRMLQELGLESAITVPLSCPGKVIGAVTLISSDAERRYNFDDLAFVTGLANRAALAIENARLYRESKLARRQAEEAATRLATLARAGEAIASSLDPEEALTRLARFITSSSLADYCVAYALDEEDETIRRVALAHADPKQQRLLEDLVRAGPPTLDDAYGAGRVLRTGKPFFAADVGPELLARSAQNAEHLEVLRRLGPLSTLVVPLRARERTFGALTLATTERSRRRYSEGELALAEELAHRAALLVDNARLYSNAVRATRARDEVLAVVSHDLRSPLQSIVTACELLVDAPPGSRAAMADSIIGAANRMHRLLEDLLEVTRIDEGRLSLHKESVDLTAFIRDTVSVHRPVAEGRHVQLAAELEGEIAAFEADRSRLSQALSNIIDNALKYTPEGGTVRVVAGCEQEAVRISVCDSGPGIPSEQLPHLFDRFWRPEGSGRKGVGLGLAISKGIAEAHGGRIEVASRPGQGARFTIVLPAAAEPPSRPAPL